MRKIVLAVLLTAAGLAGPVLSVRASSALVVNATDDVDDGACDAQHCSFREALIRAAETSEGDRIAFDRDVFPQDVPVEIRYFGGPVWFVPDDTEVDGTGSNVILRGLAVPALDLGSRTFIHGLTINGEVSVSTSGDENVVSNNTLFGAVAIGSTCDGGDQAQGNRLLRNTIVGGVDVRGFTCGLDGTVIKFNHISGGAAGALLWNASNTTIVANTFTANRYGIELESPVTGVRITRNNIAGNTDYGLVNAAGPDVEAEHNWWGSPDGPSGDGPGTGDAIYGTVDVEPWRQHPVHVPN